MYVVTYSLRDDRPDSDNYYTSAAIFTDEVLAEAKKLLGKEVRDYIVFLRVRGDKLIPSTEEAILELLILGTLWKIYSGDALTLGGSSARMLSALSEVRQEYSSLKQGVDMLKGIMSTIFLSPDLYDNMLTADPNTSHFEKLLVWLEASGEFRHEVKRLRKWQDYLSTLSHEVSVDMLQSVLALALWFEIRSEEALGCYTSNVERYLNEIRPERYWHEDVIFCGRRRGEYHLNMVGAEIMNRVNRQEFHSKKRKVIVLPACMRLLSDSKCQAESFGGNLKCTKCSNTCAVSKISRLGEKYGYSVAVVPHESSISNSKNDMLFDKDTGVIGVACILNLISGGWMLKEKGIPAQCVLLDYCGCKNHWHKEGLPTELNVGQLKRIMNI